MPPNRKPEEIDNRTLANYLEGLPDTLFVYFTGGTYRVRDGSARSTALRQITEVRQPVPLRELVRRAARLDGNLGIDPAIAEQGVRFHQGARPSVYWLLERAEDGTFRAASAIQFPDGFEAVEAGDLVLDANGGIRLQEADRKPFAAPRRLSPVMREHYEVGRSFGLDVHFSAAEFGQRYRTMFPGRNVGSILPADYTPQPRNEDRPQFLEKVAESTYRFVDLISHDWTTASVADAETFESSFGPLSPETALRYLAERFNVVRPPVQYMAGFKTRTGRPLALDRQATFVSLFLEQGGWTRSGVEIVKQYNSDESRHSNLVQHAPSLASGNPAVKVRINTWQALAALCDEYEDDNGQVDHQPVSPISGTNHEEAKYMAQPTNLILYGPPGTGKTFATAAEAIRLCGLNPDEISRADVMSAYLDLVSRRRIEFITFHQSYSYEDFVEGLRPDVVAQDGVDQPKAGGFQLVDRPGVFRALAERAMASKGSRPEGVMDLSGRQAFKMSLGRSGDDEQAYLFEEALKGGYVLLGYGGDIDWSDPQYNSFEEIRARWLQNDPSAKGNDPNIQQTFALRSWMKEGDLVIVSDGNKRFRAVGMVTGPYRHVQRERDEYYHQRPVKWLWSDSNGLPREDIYDRGFSQVSIYTLDPSAVKWPALAELVSGSQVTGASTPDPFVLIVDEINRANVSKVFGELITLIEVDKRQGQPNELSVTLPYSGKTFSVPSNLHIIGTMNTADRSIALLDTALRRRFRFRELLPDPGQLPEEIQGIPLRQALYGMNSRIEYLYDRDHQIGHAYFMECNSRENVDEVMRHKIIPLLVEYFYEDWEKVRAVLNERNDDGMFVSRSALKAPSTLAVSDGEYERWRYSVKPRFLVEAYAQLAE